MKTGVSTGLYPRQSFAGLWYSEKKCLITLKHSSAAKDHLPKSWCQLPRSSRRGKFSFFVSLLSINNCPPIRLPPAQKSQTRRCSVMEQIGQSYPQTRWSLKLMFFVSWYHCLAGWVHILWGDGTSEKPCDSSAKVLSFHLLHASLFLISFPSLHNLNLNGGGDAAMLELTGECFTPNLRFAEFKRFHGSSKPFLQGLVWWCGSWDNVSMSREHALCCSRDFKVKAWNEMLVI